MKDIAGYSIGSAGSQIRLVGTLRPGTLRQDGKKVMALSNNKMYYPNAAGNYMPAYRAYFYDPTGSATLTQHVRIVVEGEDTSEIEIVDGEMVGADLVSDRNQVRKYIENGILVIEREGVRYNAQGKRLD